MRSILALLVAAVLLAGCAAPATARSEPMPIDDVVVQVAESFPPQVRVQVRGSLPNGCYSPGAISQVREGNTITVTVLMNHSGAEVCTMVLGIFDQTIALKGEFGPGVYTVVVNGVDRSFTI